MAKYFGDTSSSDMLVTLYVAAISRLCLSKSDRFGGHLVRISWARGAWHFAMHVNILLRAKKILILITRISSYGRFFTKIFGIGYLLIHDGTILSSRSHLVMLAFFIAALWYK